MNKTIVVGLIIAQCCLLGCAPTPEEQLVGKWEFTEDPGVVTQLSIDGNISIPENPNNPSNFIDVGKWEIIGDGRLKTVVIGETGTHTNMWDYSIEGDSMTTIDPEGYTHTFTRIK